MNRRGIGPLLALTALGASVAFAQDAQQPPPEPDAHVTHLEHLPRDREEAPPEPVEPEAEPPAPGDPLAVRVSAHLAVGSAVSTLQVAGQPGDVSWNLLDLSFGVAVRVDVPIVTLFTVASQARCVFWGDDYASHQTLEFELLPRLRSEPTGAFYYVGLPVGLDVDLQSTSEVLGYTTDASAAVGWHIGGLAGVDWPLSRLVHMSLELNVIYHRVGRDVLYRDPSGARIGSDPILVTHNDLLLQLGVSL